MDIVNNFSKIEIYETEPSGFKPLVEISACYIEINGKILLLQQALAKQEPGKWGVPAGKIEPLETPKQAAYRELFEETGIQVEETSQLRYLGCLYIRKPALEYVYHLFQVLLVKVPSVNISQEHQSYQWQELHHLSNIPFMLGAREGIMYYQKQLFRVASIPTVSRSLE